MESIEKAIKLRVYQDHARFTLRAGGSETLPLPAFQTVSGFVHAMCEWKTYHELNISVAGKGFYNEEIKMLWAGGMQQKNETEDFKKRFPVRVYDEEQKRYTGWVSVPKHIDYISCLNMILHIQPHDEVDFETIYNAFLNPPVYPAIGEYDNIARIDSVEVVDTSDIEEEIEIKTPIYVPIECYRSEILSTVYNLNRKYDIVNGIRKSEKVKCYYLSDCKIKLQAKIDRDGDVVCFT